MATAVEAAAALLEEHGHPYSADMLRRSLQRQEQVGFLVRQGNAVADAIDKAIGPRIPGLHPNLAHLLNMARAWRVVAEDIEAAGEDPYAGPRPTCSRGTFGCDIDHEPDDEGPCHGLAPDLSEGD